MNLLNLSSKEQEQQKQIEQYGRVIAQEADKLKVEKEKNMAKAEKRKTTMLSNAAERLLGGVPAGSRKN